MLAGCDVLSIVCPSLGLSVLPVNRVANQGGRFWHFVFASCAAYARKNSATGHGPWEPPVRALVSMVCKVLISRSVTTFRGH